MRRFVTVFAALAGLAAAPAPYDALKASFGVHVDDPGWADKVRSVARDEYHFWRGTRDLFYAWSGEHCRDWLDDSSTIVVSQGDPHWGNLGAYAARPFGTLAYGLVDFDESARLPFQLDLLQGLVTFELIARQNGFPLDAAGRRRLADTLFDAYATPAGDSGLKALVKDASDVPYADEVHKFTRDDQFRPTAANKHGTVTDTLRPLEAPRRAALAAALAEAVAHDARLAKLLRPQDAADFDRAILDAADRTRLDSSGSQGLSKILVLLRRPFHRYDGDGLLYLKQQLPAAAERAGVAPPVDGPPARRYVRDMDVLTHGRALASSWCDFAGRSYWVSVKDPWAEEPDYKAINDADALLNAAAVWARVVADGHGDAAPRLRPLLTADLRDAIAGRAADCLAWNADAYARFGEDNRVKVLTDSVKTP